MSDLANAVIRNFVQEQAARGIELDAIQREALAALASGSDVLLSAPTGSGKTMVALGAAELALASGQRFIYTAPIKALSNQKYREFAARYGEEYVGLLTGDASINRTARVLVLTTEVLRNMLYARDVIAHDIGYVVLDEVHYLADPARGPVWEEIILQLPEHTRLVSLSATVANYAELGDWLQSVRGQTAVIASRERPVPLRQYVARGGEMRQLFDADGKVTPKAAALMRRAAQGEMTEQGAGNGRLGNPHNGHYERAGHGRAHRQRQAVTSQDRLRILRSLGQRGMLPAIEFIFSRKGCDRAVADLLDADVSLTTSEQEQEIAAALTELRAELSADDARTIRFNFWAKALRRGFGAHHAGIFPALKELTETLMARGLLSLVYATGTLALGIDMPVRTVVLESLQRFDGADFVNLSATEYTQLIGRAGRRGKDDVGHAVILATPELSAPLLAAVGSGQLEPLRSAFFPSYNAVAHLLAHSDYGSARAMISTSFAQFQANRTIVQLEARAGRIAKRIATIETKLANACDRGSIVEYARLRAAAGRASKAQRKQAKAEYKKRMARSWAGAVTGHLYAFAVAGELEYAVVLSVHKGRLRVVTIDGALRWLGEHMLTSELRDLGELPFPFGLSFKDPQVRADFAQDIFAAVAERIDIGSDHDLEGSWDRAAAPENPALAAHPVNSCPDLPRHLRQTQELVTLDKELAQVRSYADAATDTVAGEFDATAAVLGKLGYLQGLPATPRRAAGVRVKLSEGAAFLQGIHNESDLLITLSLAEDAFTKLRPAEFAGICACFLGDRRFSESSGSRNGRTSRRASGPLPAVLVPAWNAILRNYEFLHELEQEQGIVRTSEPLSGAAGAFLAWAAGAPLAQILRQHKIDVGDFIAADRRLIDLLRQLVSAGAESYIGALAADAIQLIKRWEWL